MLNALLFIRKENKLRKPPRFIRKQKRFQSHLISKATIKFSGKYNKQKELRLFNWLNNPTYLGQKERKKKEERVQKSMKLLERPPHSLDLAPIKKRNLLNIKSLSMKASLMKD